MSLRDWRGHLWAALTLLFLGFLLPTDSVQGQLPRKWLLAGTSRSNVAGISSAGSSTIEGALNLLLPMGAKGMSMGRAVTTSQGSESAFWNPAGLGQIGENRFVILRRNDFVGEATAFSLIFANQPIGVLAFSYQHLDLGDQDHTDRDNNTIGTFSNRDHLGIVSFATQVLPGLDVGVNFKIFQTKKICRGQCAAGVTGTTYLVDLGIQSTPFSGIPLRIGAMVAHFGADLQIINAAQADPPPTRVRVAGSYELLNHFLDRSDMEFWATAELEDRLLELGSLVLYLGAEFLAGQGDQIFLRAGYGQGQSGQPAGAAVGLGLKYQQFEIGIAKSLSGQSLSGESEPAHVTFGVLF